MLWYQQNTKHNIILLTKIQLKVFSTDVSQGYLITGLTNLVNLAQFIAGSVKSNPKMLTATCITQHKKQKETSETYEL